MPLISPTEYALVAVFAILVGIAVLVALRAMNDWRPVGASGVRRLVIEGWRGLRTVRIGDVVRLVLTVVLCVLIVFLVLLAVFGSIATVAILFAVVLVCQRYRRARQQAILSTLAVAAERGIPLASVLRAFVAERRGAAARAACKVATYLESGETLPEALADVGGLVPRQAMLKIRVGQESGGLIQALREAGQSEIAAESVRSQVGGKLVYLGFLGLFMALVFVFVLLKIAPAFAKIFQDFGADLPAATKFFTSASYAAVVYWYLWIWPLVVAPGYVLVWAVTGFEADFPCLRRLAARLDTAAILESLALVAERQRPITGGLTTLANHYPKASVRRRLAMALATTIGGTDWADSLRAQGLIRAADLAVLRAAQRLGNLPWALRELAEGNRRRFTYRAYVFLQFFFPLAILFFGLTVAAFAVAYFSPLISLIQKLCG